MNLSLSLSLSLKLIFADYIGGCCVFFISMSGNPVMVDWYYRGYSSQFKQRVQNKIGFGDIYRTTISKGSGLCHVEQESPSHPSSVPCPVLRANHFPEVMDPFCRLPLSALFHWPEAVHLINWKFIPCFFRKLKSATIDFFCHWDFFLSLQTIPKFLLLVITMMFRNPSPLA